MAMLWVGALWDGDVTGWRCYGVGALWDGDVMGWRGIMGWRCYGVVVLWDGDVIGGEALWDGNVMGWRGIMGWQCYGMAILWVVALWDVAIMGWRCGLWLSRVPLYRSQGELWGDAAPASRRLPRGRPHQHLLEDPLQGEQRRGAESQRLGAEAHHLVWDGGMGCGVGGRGRCGGDGGIWGRGG